MVKPIFINVSKHIEVVARSHRQLLVIVWVGGHLRWLICEPRNEDGDFGGEISINETLTILCGFCREVCTVFERGAWGEEQILV